MSLLRVAAVLSLACMLMTAIPAQESVPADPPGTRADGDRTVTLELLTATWCAGCPYADAVADRLLRVIGPERLSVIQYHVTMTDPMRINESDARRHTYGDPGLPSLFLDGEFKSDEATSYEETFDRYLTFVQESLQVDTPVSMGLTYDLGGGSVTLNTSMDSSESLVGQNLFLRVVLFENILEDGGKIYNYTARAYNETSVDLVSSPTIESVTFALDGSWVVENMGAAAFLQVDSDGGIYQSVNVMFGDPPVVTITSPSGGSVSGDLTVEGSCTGGRTLSEVFLKTDDGLWVEVEGTTTWQHDIDTTTLSDGSHTIYAKVYDVAGTYSQTDVLSITVENEEPVPGFETALLLVAFLSVAVILGGIRRLKK
ncbi:MAG: Ig-like domain-containing protein [Candidatus Thermoplasmatota archaeon]|nr:Ig-like domain-containing protein [Candidatus Thermoplasmatota archaeon]